jgi:hypothetical protein
MGRYTWTKNPGLVANSGFNYTPGWDLSFGIGSGAPALQTDHQPVLARIRVYTH